MKPNCGSPNHMARAALSTNSLKEALARSQPELVEHYTKRQLKLKAQLNREQVAKLALIYKEPPPCKAR